MHITNMGNITTIILSFCVINKILDYIILGERNIWGKILGEKSLPPEYL